MEREVGGGIGMGNTCKSMGDSCYCIKILIFQDRTVCPIFGAQSPNPLPSSYSSREKEQNELSLKRQPGDKIEICQIHTHICIRSELRELLIW